MQSPLPIFYKEYYKTRTTLLLGAIVLLAVVVYIFIDLNQTIRFNGTTTLVAHILMRDARIATQIKLPLLLFGIAVALSQYIPEMINKRLKLTMHLPLPEGQAVRAMLCWGALCVAVVCAIVYAALHIGLSLYFAPQIVSATTGDTLVWMAGAIASYMLSTWIVIEPTWRGRICNTIVTLLLLYPFAMPTACAGAYDRVWWLIVLIVVVSVSFALHSACRFKRGAL